MQRTGYLRKVSKYMWLAICFLIGVSAYKMSAAGIVEFAPMGKQFRNEEIYESRHMRAVVGLIGDLINLEDGEYVFTINAPRNYRVHIALSMNAQIVQVTESTAYFYISEGCAEIWDISWDIPKATTSRTQMITTIHLPDVRFLRNSGGGTCEQPSSIGCDRRQFLITVDSNPPNAEIWLNGENTGFAHSGVETRRFVLRGLLYGRPTAPQTRMGKLPANT